MRLSDIIGGASDLSFYPKVALVLFVAVFLSILYRTLRRPRVLAAHLASLPLEDAEVSPIVAPSAGLVSASAKTAIGRRAVNGAESVAAEYSRESHGQERRSHAN